MCILLKVHNHTQSRTRLIVIAKMMMTKLTMMTTTTMLSNYYESQWRRLLYYCITFLQTVIYTMTTIFMYEEYC